MTPCRTGSSSSRPRPTRTPRGCSPRSTRPSGSRRRRPSTSRRPGRRPRPGTCTRSPREIATGEAAGGGVAVAVRDGISEVAGIAVRPRYERRGLGAALTLHLTRAAFAAGATLVFLTPAGDAQERIYARVGYRRTDSVLFLEKAK
ncbi:GNAT family N-acetyltransferase [Dactylosporangium sp. CA-139066]|uniref:GNAT family N-acetyltransferase n=1 Tax=Dactylosporangium sp. CA-139066 TaxID=3239930 RepID=UPI003D9150D4